MSTREQNVALKSAAASGSPGTGSHHTAGLADDFRGLLSHITDQILDQDRRHTETLQSVQSRLNSLGQETRDVRARVPAQAAPVLDRIENGINKLGARIADASTARPANPPMALKSGNNSAPAPAMKSPATAARHAAAPVYDTVELVDARAQNKGPGPWDNDTAEALTRVYEALSSGANPRPAARPQRPQPAPRAQEPALHAPAAAAVGCADRQWLEDRLSKIAGSVEQILTENRQEGVIQAFGDRFGEFEDRMGSALESVATRADVEGLRVMETHLTELAQHFDAAHSRLERLDGIESQLQSVMSQLSDERLSQLVPSVPAAAMPADLERLVSTAAEMAATQVHKLAPPARDDAAQDLKAALDTFMTERRQGDEQTAAMLEMMQQALERVLERLDSLDTGAAPAYAQDPGQHAPSAPQYDAYAANNPAPAMAPAPAAGQTAHRNYAFEDQFQNDQFPSAPAAQAPQMDAWQNHQMAAPANAGTADDQFEDFDNPAYAQDPAGQFDPAAQSAVQAPASDGRPLSAIEKIRQDFIADAQKAKLKAAADAEAKAAEAQANAKTGGKKKAKAKNGLEPAGASSAFSSKSRLVVFGALAVIIAVMGSLLLMPKKGAKRKPAPQAAIEQPLLPDGKTAKPQAGAADGAKSAPAPDAKSSNGESSEDLGFETEPGPAKQDMKLEPSQSATPPDDEMALKSPVDAPLSIDLIRLDGASNAGAAEAPVAAALRLEPQSTTSEPIAQDGVRNTNLDLPPITVGPLSLRLAAGKGDPSAEFEVAARLAEGKGITQDFKEAMRWYQRSATRGFAQSQYRLGTLYERGLGAKTDLARARVWYQRAAEQGNVKAMHNLAVLSAGRMSGNPDYPTAAKWFATAADYGLADSQFNLAVLTESGLGVAKDLAAAYKWFSIAARSGDPEAVRRRDAVKTQLTPAQLAEATDAINGYAPIPSLPIINDARTAGEDWKKRQVSEGSR